MTTLERQLWKEWFEWVEMLSVATSLEAKATANREATRVMNHIQWQANSQYRKTNKH